MPGSVWTQPNVGYRFGFNGMEKDDEWGKATGIKLYSDARIYDSNTCRWLSLDPKISEYPNWSPYNFSLNNPIYYVDPNGLQPSSTDETIDTEKLETKSSTTALSEPGEMCLPSENYEPRNRSFLWRIPEIEHQELAKPGLLNDDTEAGGQRDNMFKASLYPKTGLEATALGVGGASMVGTSLLLTGATTTLYSGMMHELAAGELFLALHTAGELSIMGGIQVGLAFGGGYMVGTAIDYVLKETVFGGKYLGTWYADIATSAENSYVPRLSGPVMNEIQDTLNALREFNAWVEQTPLGR